MIRLILPLFFVTNLLAQSNRMPMPHEDDAELRIRWEQERLIDPATGIIPRGIRQEELEFANSLPRFMSPTSVSRNISPIDARGPWNFGGRTRAVALDVNNENSILAGSVNGGMWRSSNGGASWTRVSPRNQNPAITDIFQDKRPGHTNEWYYTTGEGYGASASGAGAYYLGNGLYKSTDGGNTWSVISSTATNTPHTFDNIWDLEWRVVVDPADTVLTVIYAATYGAIMRSPNGGNSWVIDLGTTSGSASYFTDIAVTSQGVLYATLSNDGPSGGIWRKDRNTGWVDITPFSMDTSAFERLVIGINPSNENEVYFLGQTPGRGKRSTNYKGEEEWNSLLKYNYVSGNGTGIGGQWTDLSAQIPQDSTLQLGNFNAQGGYNLVVKVHPSDPNTVIIGATNLYRSTDGFTTDSNITVIGGYEPTSTIPFYVNYPNNHSDQHQLYFYPSNPDKMLQACDGGLYRTDNVRDSFVTWNSIGEGYLTSQFYTCAVDHASTGTEVMGGTQDNGTWFTSNSNLTSPWAQPGFGDGGYCAMEDGHQVIYTSRQEGRVAKMQIDSSGNVIAFRRIDPIGATNYQFIAPFTLDPNNQNRMYLAAGSRLWRNDSLDIIPLSGQWDTISTGWAMLPDSVAGAKITAVAACKTPANRVYYGYGTKRVFRADNADTQSPTVTDITGTLVFPSTASVSCIAVDPNNGDHLLVSFSNYRVYSIFSSNDAGASWTKVAGNLEATAVGTTAGPSVRWVSIVPTASGNVYLAGTSTGLYATSRLNGTGTIWTDIGASTIGNIVVDMMDVRTSDGFVAIGTHGSGMYSMFITDTITSSLATPDPYLSDVSTYPNPSSGGFTVKFTLESAQMMSIRLVDIRGSVVKLFEESRLGPGDH
ncbi:MAG: hypothetical protein ACKOKF_09300, partial [Bacteroidota bacterium]